MFAWIGRAVVTVLLGSLGGTAFWTTSHIISNDENDKAQEKEIAENKKSLEGVISDNKEMNKALQTTIYELGVNQARIQTQSDDTRRYLEKRDPTWKHE